MTIGAPLPALAFFASPWMLLWGLAAALPLILHYWSRRQRQETTWAAMEFVVAAVRKNARRLKLEQLLLLAVRTAILALFALALADPLLEAWTGAAPAAARPAAHTILVIDASYSMDYRAERASAFELAKQQAADVVRAAAPGDSFSLVLLGDPPQAIIGRPSHDASLVLDELAGLELSHGGARLTPTLTLLRDLLESAGDSGEASPNVVRKVLIFTDLQGATWREVRTRACRDALARLEKHAELSLIPLGDGSATDAPPNAAIVELSAVAPLAVVGQEVRFRAVVRNFAGGSGSRQVEFFVDGKRQQAVPLELPLNGQKTAGFRHRFNSTGDHAVEARLSADRLPLDDRRFFSFSVRPAISVLCLEGEPGAARYLALALAPDDSPNGAVQVSVRSEAALRQLRLDDFDCVFLCNPGRLSESEAESLGKYVCAGGALVLVLGDRATAASFNQRLAAGDLRVSPAEIVATSELGEYRLDPLGYRHALTAPFRGHDAAGLLTTPVWKYHRLKPAAPSTSRVALAFTNGDPAIVEERIGQGRSIVVATDFSDLSIDATTSPPTTWSAWPAWPSFPPIVQEMLKLCLSSQGSKKNLAVGQPMRDERPNGGVDSTTVTNPAGQTVRVTAEDGAVAWRFDQTLRQGMYELKHGDDSEIELFAVNLDTGESDLASLAEERLPSQLQKKPMPGDDPTGQTPAARKPAFRFLLGGVLALLLVESTLALAFGRWLR